MNNVSQEEREQRARGERAENVSSWYFRLNGFLSIPGFVVHLDRSTAHIPADGIPRYARTEADFMGIRFPNSREEVGGRLMEDDPTLTSLAATGSAGQVLFVLVETKSGLCKMNGPWTDRSKKNMERVVRRLGFTTDERQINEVAEAMYGSGRWCNDSYVLQYICVGGRQNQELNEQYPQLVQIDWNDIAHFLLRRFQSFPEKLPDGHVHRQWPDFGRKYSLWFTRNSRKSISPQNSAEAVKLYINNGRCETA